MRKPDLTIVTPPGDIEPAKLPPERMERMAAAADVVAECRRVLRKTGHNVVGEVLRGEAEFLEWNHYPDGDVYDPETHAQYYYHAHPADDRPTAEHGHFHLFLRPKGMPAGVEPSAGQTLPDGDNDALADLVAISMDSYGEAIGLFTTNRWVTGSVWYPAAAVIRMLDEFEIDVVRPNLVVNRWLTAMVHLFRPEIETLLNRRDAAIDAWRVAHPDSDVFEDRRLELTSMVAISPDIRIAQIRKTRPGKGDNVSDA